MTAKYEELELVSTLVEKDNVPTGTTGTIVHVYSDNAGSKQAYEVEFGGDIQAVVTYDEDEITVASYSVIFTGFHTKEQALHFAKWYSYCGDQDSEVWMQEHAGIASVQGEIIDTERDITLRVTIHK